MKLAWVVRLAALAVAAALVGSMVSSQASDYASAKKKYDGYIKKPSLLMRTRGRIILAQTGDIRALKIFAENYAKPEAPKEQVRSLLVTTSAENFKDQAHVPVYQDWRNKNLLPVDAWLWYRTFGVTQSFTGDEELVVTAKDTKKDLFIRAAAMEQLADVGSDRILALLSELQPALEKAKGNERMLMLETCAHMFQARGHELGTDKFREVGVKFIPLMDDKDTLDRTRLVMARYFREVFGGEKLWINSDPWLNRLLNPEKPEDASDSRYKQPPLPPTKFIGLAAAGIRIVYVIDLSDSMMAPMSVKEKEEIKKPPPPPVRKGPTTPGKGEKADKPEEKKEAPKEEEKPKNIEDEMPWSKIHNRFQCAREYLKLSLKSLRPGQQFCVILFGTDAKTLNTTKGLVDVKPETITAAIRELDNIKPGPAIPDRKHGTLMGYTNMHGGLHRAFKVKQGGMVKEGEYVDYSTFTTGADTIFLLSDGDPSWDDWMQEDEWDNMDRAGDPESGTPGQKQPIVRAVGPYGYMYDFLYLPDDVKRENLFRKCEINCIGIGEVTPGYLQKIAAAALGGQVKMVGGK